MNSNVRLSDPDCLVIKAYTFGTDFDGWLGNVCKEDYFVFDAACRNFLFGLANDDPSRRKSLDVVRYLAMTVKKANEGD